MILTLAQLSSRATSLIQGRTDITSSDASFWVNVAYEEMATRIRYAADEGLAISSTTSGENRIALPSDFRYQINVSNLSVDGTERTLTAVEAYSLDSRNTTLGAPTHYAMYADWMELWPSPDSAYSVQLRYGKKLPTLTASTNTALVEDRYHTPLIFLSASYMAASVNDLEGEAVNKARYLSNMGSSPSELELRQRDKFSMRVQFMGPNTRSRS